MLGNCVCVCVYRRAEIVCVVRLVHCEHINWEFVEITFSLLCRARKASINT